MLFFNILDRVLHLQSRCCWYEWHQRRRITDQSSPSSCAVKAHIYIEESVDSRCSRSLLRHWNYRWGWQTWSLLLSHLQQKRFGVDAKSTWKPEAVSRCQAFCPWPAIETGDTWVAGTGFWGKPPQWERLSQSVRASTVFDVLWSFGIESIVCRGSDCWRFWSHKCHVASPC